MSNITFVSDYWQGFNVLTAFENINRHSCCGDLINTVLKNLFDSTFLNHKENGNKTSRSINDINYQMQTFGKMYEELG